MDRDSQLDTHSATLTTTDRLFTQAVRPRDLPAFYALQERNQERVKLLLQAFESIDKAPTFALGYEMAAAQLGKTRGFTAGTLRRLHTAWRKTQDWRELVDGALEHSPAAKVPQDFVEYLNSEVDQNGRSKAAAFKRIRAAWTRGEHIPGYGTWKEWWQRTHPGRPLPRLAPPHPTGWSNLYRKVDSSKFRRAAATLGRGAARKHRPMVLSSRKGCYVASHYMWDDVWHDLFVNSFLERQAGRPLELFSHDYFSGRKVRWGVKVRTEDDNGKSSGLTGKMMRMVIAATYYLDGYSPRGTINLAEHGTANFMEEIGGILYDASGGLITVEESGMQGKAAHAGQYDGRSLGNPNFKASLESSNNLLHNMEAHLPGQTGPDRQRRPEQLHGMLQYNSRLLAAYQQLPADKAALLQFPLLEINQYLGVLGDIYRFIENDPDHDLEGWLECGHVMQVVELLGEWRTQDELLMLPDGQREMALAMIHGGMVPSRPRKMTRAEVWHRGARDLVRIHGGTVCNILGDDFATERKVQAQQFRFEDKEVGPGLHRFEAIITDAEGRQCHLKDGEKYKVFVNPFADKQLFVQDAKGRYLGTALRCERDSRLDAEALHRNMGRVSHIESEMLKPLEARQAKQTRKKLAMHKHNAGVLTGHQQAKDDFRRRATAILNASTTDHATNPPTDPNETNEPDW
ncbi:MAG: hypothetical protein WAW39_15915 [Prosthecobacter sp.]|uniref:hypothetical protein n=1 Tax=Prosthecobacter sp. TaxID=1965333 RepID=UPI003BB207DD